MKKLILVVISFIQFTAFSQHENLLLQRSFWKQNPDLSVVKNTIQQGHDATALNAYAFDAVVYALLEKANDDVLLYLLSLEGNSIEKITHDNRTYVFWAAYSGKTKIMEYLLENGAKLDIRDSHGNTPITFAASSGQLNQEVYLLFERFGASLATNKNEGGANAMLLVSPYVKDMQTITFFTNKGISLQSKDTEGNGLFQYAAKGGNTKILDELIKMGVPYKSKNKGVNAIIFASKGTRGRQNNLALYTYLSNLGIEVNATNNAQKNALHQIAYSTKDLEIFNFFIEKGVSINQQDNTGRTPFMNAASANSFEVVSHLFPWVTSLNAKDHKGRSALSLALRSNTSMVSAFLISKGADTGQVDNDGNNLAYYVLDAYSSKNLKDFEDKVALLSLKNVDFTASQIKGNTLLHEAVKRNDFDLIKRVMKFDIPVNTKNNDGLTALHIAAMKSSTNKILKYLIENGADKSIRTDFDETVYDLAKENELLESNKINLNFLK